MQSHNTQQTPEVATGQTSLAAQSPYTDKRGFAQRLQCSTRFVDGLLANGLPHLKISNRRVRILIADADNWLRDQYRVQRRAVKGA